MVISHSFAAGEHHGISDEGEAGSPAGEGCSGGDDIGDMLKKGGEDMATEGRLPGPEDRIYDLADLVVEGTLPMAGGDQGIIVIDGRCYERVLQQEDVIYDLRELLEEGPGVNSRKGFMNDDIRKIAAEMAERIAREIIPDIAERVIREEIEKLKSEDGHVS